ncbi:MAG TPA: hypothetical protein VF834_02505 [Streptosporangiaceae bacterium]
MLIRNRVAAGVAAAVAAGGLLAGAAIPAQASASQPLAARTGSAAQQYGMHMEAQLRGHGAYRSARGHADYQSYRYRHMDVSLWNVRRLAGHVVVIYVHGTRAGTMRIWSGGSGHFERGYGIPRCGPGTVITIRTRSGALVATGIFRRHWMMMR